MGAIPCSGAAQPRGSNKGIYSNITRHMQPRLFGPGTVTASQVTPQGRHKHANASDSRVRDSKPISSRRDLSLFK